MLEKIRLFLIKFKLRYFFIICGSNLLFSCFSTNEKEALSIYKKQLENINWIDLKSKSKVIFKNGNYLIRINDSVKFSGKYDLEINPNHGLVGKWEIPIKKIKFQTEKEFTSSYKVEKPLFTEKIITLKNNKNKEFLILTKDLNLIEMDSAQFRIIKEVNYNFTSIDSIIYF